MNLPNTSLIPNNCVIEKIAPETTRHTSDQSVEIGGIIWARSVDKEIVMENVLDTLCNPSIPSSEPTKTSETSSVSFTKNCHF